MTESPCTSTKRRFDLSTTETRSISTTNYKHLRQSGGLRSILGRKMKRDLASFCKCSPKSPGVLPLFREVLRASAQYRPRWARSFDSLTLPVLDFTATLSSNALAPLSTSTPKHSVACEFDASSKQPNPSKVAKCRERGHLELFPPKNSQSSAVLWRSAS